MPRAPGHRSLLLLPAVLCGFLLGLGGHLAGGTARAGEAFSTGADTPARVGFAAVQLRRLPPGVCAIDVVIDGRSVRLIVDTGDGIPGIGLTTSTARALKIKTEPSAGTVRGVSGAETLRSERGRAGVVRFAGSMVTLRDVALHVAAFPVLEAQLKTGGRLPIDGFIGADVLRNCGAIIDLPAQRLYVRAPVEAGAAAPAPEWRPDAGLRSGATIEVAMGPDPTLGDPLWVVPVEINSVVATMLVDTGNWATRLSPGQAARFGLQTLGAGQSAEDSTGNTVRTERAQPRAFKVGGHTVPATETLLLGPMGGWVRDDLVGALGIDTLRACGAVIDCGRGRLYLHRSQPPPPLVP